MKQLLNTLFVTTQGSYLCQKGDTVLVKIESEEKLRIPIHTLGSIICFGQVSCSPFLMGLCGEKNVTLSFLTENGKFLARVYGPVRGNVLLRREQYRQADDMNSSASVAKSIVIAKIANCRTLLLRATRDRPDNENNSPLIRASSLLGNLLDELENNLPLDIVRGKEGEGAKVYFDVFDHLIVVNKNEFFLRDRNRRPPLDNMNALLSFLYTILVHDIESALESVGLDPAVGFLHRDRPGRPSLALDLVEEFRPYFADRLALSLVNRQQIKPNGFRKTETGAVSMDDETRKTVLIAWQKRKQEEIMHPFLNEKVQIGLLPYIQTLLLARYLRGDLKGYPPFFAK
jgi:CRISP-associated protein Cas1